MSTPVDPTFPRRLTYSLLIVVALADVLGRILSVTNVYEPYLHRAAPDEPGRVWPTSRPEPMPTLGGNDRSRWATVRALVDQGTYVIGWREQRSADAKDYVDSGIMTEDGWQTLDKVLHPREHHPYGEESYPKRKEFYSSKPPLLPTLLAGEYWLLKHVFGWSITDRDGRWWVVRTVLVTVNWLPMAVYLVLLARLAERFGTTDWGRLYVVAAGAFATFLTPFAVVVNNHTVAACSALFALYPALRIWEPAGHRPASDGPPNQATPTHRSPLATHHFLLAGLFAGFTACCELPAASFTAGLFLLLLARAPGRTLAIFVPAAALPVAGLLLTNYLAIGEVAPAYSKLESPWYKYEGSYWRADETKRGIDWAWQKESKAVYAFHLLLGHHGLFSLSPVWLLALAGIAVTMLRRDPDTRYGLWPALIQGRADPGRSAGLITVSALTLFLTVVVVGFYLFGAKRMSNNYGGWTCGPRWFLWLTPFWLLTLLPAADRLAACRWGRVVGYVLLGVSVVSVSYPAWNPWRHPWIYNYLEAQGWIRY